MLKPLALKTFYIVFTYIIVFTLWWAYLLYDKNETAFKEKVQLNEIAFLQHNPQSNYLLTEEYQKLHTKYIRQKIMIVTEGAVFIVLLIVGLLRVRKVFMREIALVIQQQNFLLSITHELKSPLASIKIALQTLALRKPDASQVEKLLGNSMMDVERLEALVENILFAAKIEREDPGFSNAETNISAIAGQAASGFAQNKKSISLKEEIEPDIMLRVDPLGFSSVINNLLENSIKYSPFDTEVRISLKKENDKILIEVADNGIGIPEEERDKVFEKFYRIGNENTRTTKGTGLGLYIVKRFVEI